MKTKKLFLCVLIMLFGVVAVSQAQTAINLARKYGTICEQANINTSYPAQRLLDGTASTTYNNSTTCRASGNGAVLTVVVDLHGEYELTSAIMKRGSTTASYCVNNYKISVGNSPDALTQLVNQDKTTNSDETYTFPSGTKARYVKLEAKSTSNPVHMSEFEIFGYDVVDPTLISTLATIHSKSGQVNDGEGAQQILTNSLATKWCATGNGPHWVIIDLGLESDIEKIAVYDGRTREGGSDIYNLALYQVFVGNAVDGNNLLDADNQVVSTPIISELISDPNALANDVKEAILPAGTKGRYVKFAPIAASGGTIRIYEFKIFGPVPPIILDKVADQKIVDGASVPVTVNYVLNAEKQDFSYEVTSSNGEVIQIQNLQENGTSTNGVVNGTISFTLTGPADRFAASDITVKVVNNGDEFSNAFITKTQLTSPSLDNYVNVALGKTSGTWNYPTNNNWTWESDATGNLTDGDPATSYLVSAKSMMNVLVDLGDQYMVEGIQFKYQYSQDFNGFDISSSPKINIPPNDANYEPGYEPGFVLQDRMPGGTTLNTEVMSFTHQAVVGTIKADLQATLWSTQGVTMNLYELYAYVEKPTLSQPADFTLNPGNTKNVELDFDLKGFSLISDKETKVTATAISQGDNAADIATSNVQINFETKKISLTVAASGSGANVPVNVTITNGEFSVTKTFTVEIPAKESIIRPADEVIRRNQLKSVTINYSLGIVAEDPALDINAVAVDGTVIELLNKQLDKEAKTVTYDVKGLKKGTSDVNITLVNGEIGSATNTFSVEVLEIESITKPANITDLKEKEIRNITIQYGLGDIAKDGNFNIGVEPASAGFVEIQNIDISVDNKVSFDVKGLLKGAVALTVTMTNGATIVTETFDVTVLEIETLAEPQNFDVRKGSSRPYALSYSLGDMTKESNFNITVVSDNLSVATIADKNIDEAGSEVSFDIVGGAKGNVEITVTLINGTVSIVKSFDVTVLENEALVKPADEVINERESKSVTAYYSLGDIEKKGNFNVAVTPVDAEKASISNVNMETAGEVTFTVNGLLKGSTVVNLVLTNDTITTTETFTVTVLEVESIIIPQELAEGLELVQGGLEPLTISYSLGDMIRESDFAITVSSNNEAVATLPYGSTPNEIAKTVTFTVEGVSEGDAVITVTLTNRTVVTTASFNVSVAEVIPEFMTVSDVNLDMGETKEFRFPYDLGTVGDQGLSIFLNYICDTEIAEIVSEETVEGEHVVLIKGNKAGTTSETVTLSNGSTWLEYDFAINVAEVIPESMTVSDVNLDEGETKEVRFPYSLGTIGDKGLSISLSNLCDTEIAEIVSDEAVEGEYVLFIKGNKAGTTTEKITLSNGSTSLEYDFTINIAEVIPESMTVSDVTLDKGETKEFRFPYSLGTIGDQGLSISLSNLCDAEIAEVVSDETLGGEYVLMIKGNKAGTTNEKITLSNGSTSLEYDFTITVSPVITDLVQPETAISVWPTMVSKGASVNVTTEKASKVRIVSLLGVVVYEQEVNIGLTSINTSGLGAGIYFLQFENEENVFRFVVK